MREITAIALDITTVCNLRCPECCVRVGERDSYHYPWWYFEALAPYVRGIDRIDITGGEPTTHPKFAEFVPKFRDLFQCRSLTLETNGFKAREYASLLHHFDFIRLSRYRENAEAVDWILHNFNSFVQNGATCVEINAPADDRGHVSRDRRGSGAPCHLGRCEFVSYTANRFYPCRLGPAVQGAQSVELCPDWRARVLSLDLPCDNCWFSP